MVFVAFSDVCRVFVFSFVDLNAPFGLFMCEKSQGRLHGIIVKHNATVKLGGQTPLGLFRARGGKCGFRLCLFCHHYISK